MPHYLETVLNSPLHAIVTQLIPGHSYKSIYDLFNSQLFFKLFLSIVRGIDGLSSCLQQFQAREILNESLDQQLEQKMSKSYTELKSNNFQEISECIQTAFSILNIPVGKPVTAAMLENMVTKFDLNILQTLIGSLFELMIMNHQALRVMTEMNETDQANVKDFIVSLNKDRAMKSQVTGDIKFYEEIEELEKMVVSKDEEIAQLKINNEHYLEEITQLKHALRTVEEDLSVYKQKLMSYEEIEVLMQEKDEDIHKMSVRIVNLETKNRLDISELTVEKDKKAAAYKQLQMSYFQLRHKLEENMAVIEALNKQKEDSEASSKKVIHNLKENNKQISERYGVLQRQLIELNFDKEIKEREYNEAINALEMQRNNSQDDTRRNECDTLLSNSQIHPKSFLRLGEELQEMKGGIFEEEIEMYERAGEESMKQFQEILKENARLKDRLSKVIPREDYEKTQRKLKIQKENYEQIVAQKQEEIDVLIAAFFEKYCAVIY